MIKTISHFLITLSFLAVIPARAAIEMTLAEPQRTQDWSGGVPGKGDWLSYLGPGSQGTLTDFSSLATAVNNVSHGAALEGGNNTSTMVGTTAEAGGFASDWFSPDPRGRFNTVEDFFQFAFGNDGSLMGFLQARLRNSTGSPMRFLQVSFELAKHIPFDGVEGPLPGISVFTSRSDPGNAGTWDAVAGWTALDTVSEIALGQKETFTTTLDFGGNINSGDEMFVRWAVDNANGNDIQYTIDNIVFTVVPEPATGLLTASAAAALGFIRRRRM